MRNTLFTIAVILLAGAVTAAEIFVYERWRPPLLVNAAMSVASCAILVAAIIGMAFVESGIHKIAMHMRYRWLTRAADRQRDDIERTVMRWTNGTRATIRQRR